MTDEELTKVSIWSYLGEDAYKNHLADLREKMTLPVEPFDTEEPPLPDMHKEGNNWIPDDVEVFSVAHSDIDVIGLRTKRIKRRLELQRAASQGNQLHPEQQDNSVPGAPKTHDTSTTKEPSDSNTAIHDATPPSTKLDGKETTSARRNSVSSTVKVAETATTIDAIIMDEMIDAGESNGEPTRRKAAKFSEAATAAATPASTKPLRISAKMRRASRQEFHDLYLVKTDTKEGSPITIAPDLLKRAYRICRLSGDHRARPTYLINNLLREFLDTIEPDTAGWSELD